MYAFFVFLPNWCKLPMLFPRDQKPLKSNIPHPSRLSGTPVDEILCLPFFQNRAYFMPLPSPSRSAPDGPEPAPPPGLTGHHLPPGRQVLVTAQAVTALRKPTPSSPECCSFFSRCNAARPNLYCNVSSTFYFSTFLDFLPCGRLFTFTEHFP